MFYHTYFIITPGYDMSSYVQYRNYEGNYIKFGDSKSPHEDSEGIRRAYMTHNPDIGIMAVMNSEAFQDPGLGTRLKRYMLGLEVPPVGSTEWFALQRDRAWSLARAMLRWDRKTLRPADENALEELIRHHLVDGMDQGSLQRKQLHAADPRHARAATSPGVEAAPHQL